MSREIEVAPDPEWLAALDLDVGDSDCDSSDCDRFATFSFVDYFNHTGSDELCDPELPWKLLELLKLNRTLSTYQSDVSGAAMSSAKPYSVSRRRH